MCVCVCVCVLCVLVCVCVCVCVCACLTDVCIPCVCINAFDPADRQASMVCISVAFRTVIRQEVEEVSEEEKKEVSKDEKVSKDEEIGGRDEEVGGGDDEPDARAANPRRRRSGKNAACGFACGSFCDPHVFNACRRCMSAIIKRTHTHKHTHIHRQTSPIVLLI